MANLAVFIWVADTTISIGDVVYISETKLEQSIGATKFEYENVKKTQGDAKKRFNKYTVYGNSPNAGGSLLSDTVALVFPVEMAKAPTITKIGGFEDEATLSVIDALSTTHCRVTIARTAIGGRTALTLLIDAEL